MNGKIYCTGSGKEFERAGRESEQDGTEIPVGRSVSRSFVHSLARSLARDGLTDAQPCNAAAAEGRLFAR